MIFFTKFENKNQFFIRIKIKIYWVWNKKISIYYHKKIIWKKKKLLFLADGIIAFPKGRNLALLVPPTAPHNTYVSIRTRTNSTFINCFSQTDRDLLIYSGFLNNLRFEDGTQFDLYPRRIFSVYGIIWKIVIMAKEDSAALFISTINNLFQYEEESPFRKVSTVCEGSCEELGFHFNNGNGPKFTTCCKLSEKIMESLQSKEPIQNPDDYQILDENFLKSKRKKATSVSSWFSILF